MSKYSFLRVKKLIGHNIVVSAAKHNKRAIQAEIGESGSRIDPTRSHLNCALAGPSSAADVGLMAKTLMAEAGIVKLRKDAVKALEILVSLPINHGLDEIDYFKTSTAWIGQYFGGHILAADIHLDEKQPHCHVLILPLVNKRMNGSNIVGGPKQLLAMQKQFHLDVASRYGLAKAPARLTGTAKQAAIAKVLQGLRETSDSALSSSVWATIRAAIENEPGPFVEAMGIELPKPAKKRRSMAQIFTGTGKGPKNEKPIGFASPEKERTICPVWFAQKTPLKPADKASPPTAQAAPVQPAPQALDDLDVTDRTVERDNDIDASLYDSETGEFRQRPPAPARHQRQAADAWVNSALAAMREKKGARHADGQGA